MRKGLALTLLLVLSGSVFSSDEIPALLPGTKGDPARGRAIVVAGLLLLCGSSTGLYWIAAGVILSLIGGVFNAWVLLVEILR